MNNRRHTETDRIKVGGLKPIYLHREYDVPGGQVVGVWLSCGSKYKDQDIGLLMESISEKLHECFQVNAAIGGADG